MLGHMQKVNHTWVRMFLPRALQLLFPSAVHKHEISCINITSHFDFFVNCHHQHYRFTNDYLAKTKILHWHNETTSSSHVMKWNEMLVFFLLREEPLSTENSLQSRRFWWSFKCFAAILDSLQTGRIGVRMTECRNDRMTEFPNFSFSLRRFVNFLPRPNSPLFFNFKMAAWTSDGKIPLVPPKSTCTAGYTEKRTKQTPWLFSQGTNTPLT